MREVWWGIGYLYSLKVFLHKLIINYKGENSNYAAEKMDNTLMINFNVIKFNIANNGWIDTMHL